MKVKGRKRRHESSSDEEDETVKENKRLTDRVKELEKSLATKTKESVEVGSDKKQLEEENKRLVDRVKGLDKSLATKTEENVKVGEEKELLEAERRQLNEEREHLEKEKKALQEMKSKVEEERVKVEKVLKEQQNLVECPVCLTLPREDRAVPCCPQGHFVCSPCMDELIRQGKLDCPTCRVAMGQGQSLLAVTVVKNARHECTLQGCNVSLPFGKIKEHEENCNWRLIICPSDGNSCTAMVPFCTVLTHGKNCSACELSPGRRFLDNGAEMSSYLNLDTAEAFDGKDMSWKTKILFGQGIVCFVRPSRRGGIFTIDVVMKGSKEECEEFRVKASIHDAVSRKSKFKATFQPRPLSNQNEAVYCLSVSEKAVSQVWKHNVLKKQYEIKFRVKVEKVSRL